MIILLHNVQPSTSIIVCDFLMGSKDILFLKAPHFSKANHHVRNINGYCCKKSFQVNTSNTYKPILIIGSEQIKCGVYFSFFKSSSFLHSHNISCGKIWFTEGKGEDNPVIL